MGFLSRLFANDKDEEIRTLKEGIAKRELGIEAFKPVILEATRMTDTSAEELRKSVRRSRHHAELGKKLIEDITAGFKGVKR